MFQAVIFSVLVAAALASQGGKWKYGKTGYGPQEWKKVSAHCRESAQSPINIVTSTVKKDSNLKSLRFTSDNRNGQVVGKMVNNGHSAALVINKPRGTGTLSGGPLGNRKYKLERIHIHFGCKDSKGGSEHTVNGKAYSGELHLVHYNTKYPNFALAVDHSDGLAVIGVFLQQNNHDGTSYSLRMLCSAMRKIKRADTGVMVKTYLFNLVPQLRDLSETSFYSYKGSLTTPPCYQSVNWIVLKHPIRASESVLNDMRNLHDYEEHSMCNNFRPTQPLNHRTVSEYSAE